ncbi:MAG TPA: hypothetical protein VLV54_12340 [Thermoanaerobaculia bacterium]|nr:hypothetical protein [Thermoanaerobaculia bacterium]
MPANKHPWNLTVRNFLAMVESHYGLRRQRILIQGPAGQPVSRWHLESTDKETMVLLPGGLDMDEELSPSTTASFCRRLGIPPEDFGLELQETDDEEKSDLDIY